MDGDGFPNQRCSPNLIAAYAHGWTIPGEPVAGPYDCSDDTTGFGGTPEICDNGHFISNNVMIKKSPARWQG